MRRELHSSVKTQFLGVADIESLGSDEVQVRLAPALRLFSPSRDRFLDIRYDVRSVNDENRLPINPNVARIIKVLAYMAGEDSGNPRSNGSAR